MTAKLLTSIEQWGELLKRYQQEETLCNNYMMLAEMESLINAGSLSVLENNNNLFLLQKKEKCSRVYYYLNCMNESFDIDIENDLVVEIIFRQNKGLPEQELEFLSRCGFVMYKRRDQYSGSYKEMRLRSHATGIVVREATSIEEVKCSCELFNKVFDAYSGDYISDKEIHSLFEAKAIHVATDIKGLFLGELAKHYLIRLLKITNVKGKDAICFGFRAKMQLLKKCIKTRGLFLLANQHYQ